jgi:putative ABC transport system permease protein
LRAAFTGTFASYGTNWVIIMPQAVQQGGQAYGHGRLEPFTIQDAEAIQQQAEHLDFVLPGASTGANAKHGNKNMGLEVQGLPWEYFFGPGVSIAEGRSFNEGEQKSATRVAVLGANVRKRLFAEFEDPINETIKIGGNNFVVIGVLEPKGGLDNTDNQISVPITTFQKRITGSDDIFFIIGVAPDTASLEPAKEEVRQVLRQRRHLLDPTKEDFQLMTLDDAIKFANKIVNTLIYVFGFMSVFALLVAGIGIMNIMLVTVTERTREIGLRMAIGAAPVAILLQFLTEAAVLSTLGGVLGILLGVGGAYTVGDINNWPIYVTPISVIVSFGFSAFVGIFFGFYPALRASRLNPIDCLRYE